MTLPLVCLPAIATRYGLERSSRAYTRMCIYDEIVVMSASFDGIDKFITVGSNVRPSVYFLYFDRYSRSTILAAKIACFKISIFVTLDRLSRCNGYCEIIQIELRPLISRIGYGLLEIALSSARE